MDLTPTIVPKSDQLNADDLIAGPVTVTVVEVKKGTADQPVNVVTKEFGPGRPYKPAKSMRRVMVEAWGKDSSLYAGRQLTLFRDPRVKFGGEEVGGIRISAMSNLDKPLSVALTVTRGKRQPFVVQPIGATKPADPVAAAVEHFETTFGVTRGELETRLGRASGEWTPDDLDYLRELSKALHSGQKQVEDEFPDTAPDLTPQEAATVARFGLDKPEADGSEPSPDDPAWREYERQQETNR